MNNTINPLPYLVELTDEKRHKVCIIEDLVKLALLDGAVPPTWDEFVTMYDIPLANLEQLEKNVYETRKLKAFIKALSI